MTDAQTITADDRPVWQAIRRGLMCRCPNCGRGALLDGYLKVRDHCPVCAEDYTPQRADDGPAYLTLLVVGHLMAPAILWAFMAFRPSALMLTAIFSAGTMLLSLFLLPRFTLMIVAIQWSRRMHGFGQGDATHD